MQHVSPQMMVREFHKAMGQPLDKTWPHGLMMVREFHKAMGQPLDKTWPHGLNLEGLRTKLVEEEFKEFVEAEEPEEILKELCDILYVVYGYGATYGWDMDVAFRRVHQSNMSKLGDDGKPIYREDGKVTKGPNYKAPDLADLVYP